MENFINFYPTPVSLLEKIITKEDMKNVITVLEPSAGKGDICNFIMDMREYGYRMYDTRHLKIDCIEINPELRASLKGNENGYHVIHDDFLTFRSMKKYDLIIMNPPFDAGAKHLLKAIALQEQYGGKIICILNAETIRNPYTLERQDLQKKLEEYKAAIQFMTEEFTSAERNTNVEIAVIKLTIEKELATSIIWQELKKARFVKEQESGPVTDVAVNDYIKTAVQRYEMEIEAGLKLIEEYKVLCPYLMDHLRKNEEEGKYDKPILELRCGERGLSENGFVEAVRLKYWTALFKDERFTKAMSNDMLNEYTANIRDLKDYEFSYYNIKELQVQFCSNLISSIEKTILSLFEKLSYQYAYNSEFGNNVHYYNGWCTNKAYYVNKKVILPYYCFNRLWNKMEFNYTKVQDLSDMEKAFNYLAGTPGADSSLAYILDRANKSGNFKNVECKYFTLTAYKKGTLHITFKDEELLKKLNIFAGKHYNMLPPCYGTKHYKDMTKKEQETVREFDGSEEVYEKIFASPDKYLFTTNDVSLIA